MNTLKAACLIGALITVSATTARQEDYRVENWNLRVSVIPEKTVFMLGEPIYVAYEVRNESRDAVQLMLSRQHPWTPIGRDSSFTVGTVRSDGFPVRVPEPGGWELGGSGFIGPETISPGGAYTFHLFLNHWAEIRSPGDYTITLRRNLQVGRFDSNSDRWEKGAIIQTSASARVSVRPMDRAALADVIAERSRAVFGRDEEASALSAHALAAIDDLRVVPHLSRAVTEGTYSVKWIALEALPRFEDERAITAIQQGTRDADENIRSVAAAALEKAESRRNATPVANAGRPPSPSFIPDVNPAIRHQVYFKVPYDLEVKREAGELTIRFERKSDTTLMVGSNMATGLSAALYVYPAGQSRPSEPVWRSLDTGDAFPSELALDGLTDGPSAKLKYAVEMDVVLFETDVRPQELWSPASTNYRVLWQKTLKASEK